jgi:hypothetical protein
VYEGRGIPSHIKIDVGNIRDFQARLRLDIDRALSLARVRSSLNSRSAAAG